MKYKAFFFLFVFLFFLFVLFYLYIDHLNPENVKLYTGGGKYFEAGVAAYVVASFVLGIIVSIVISFFYDLGRVIGGWRDDKKERKREELREFFEKAKAYDLKGDREKAIENLNRVIRRAPGMEESYMFLSDVYLSMREFDKAIEVLDQAETNLGKKESVLLKKVKVQLTKKDTQKIENELKEVIGINESNLDALAMLRDFYISRKDWDQALEAEKRIRRFVKTEDETRKLLGLRCEKAQAIFDTKFDINSESVIKELKEVIGEDKRFIPAYVLLAEAYKRTGKFNEAGRVYGRGYSKTGHIIFLIKMEDLYIERRSPEVILKIYRRILDISPRNNLIEFLYARLCLRLEMIDEAIEMLNGLLAEGADFKGLHKAMAEAYIHRGQMDKAVSEFRRAFPAEHVYIPFVCSHCQTKKVEWSDFCDTCLNWNTINVRKEDFVFAESTELKMFYEGEDWEKEEQL